MKDLAFRLALCAVGLSSSVMLSSRASAGNNAEGTARLSWDEAGQVLNLAYAPAAAFPLYLSLSETPDVRALAVDIQWFPTDPTGECYGLLPSTSSGECSGTSMVAPGSEFHGETTSAWWSITSPLGGNVERCVSWLVTAAGCLAPTPAVFTALIRLEDSGGDLDTLVVLVPATIGPSRATTLAAASVFPTEVVPSKSTMLHIHGSGFLPGAHVTLHNSSSQTEATRVVVLAPDDIAATLAPAPSSVPYELTVSTADGRSAVSTQAVATVTEPGSAASNPLPRPTNATGAFRTFDLWNDQSDAAQLAPNALLIPTSFNTDSLLIPRPALGDSMAVLRSTPGYCIEFNGAVPGFPTFVEYKLSPPEYATSVGLLEIGKNVLKGEGGFNDDDRPIVYVTARYEDGDSTTDTLRVGRQVRNNKSGAIACPIAGPIPYFDMAPDAPLNVELYASGGTFFDAQEVRLPASKRSKRVSAIRVGEILIFHEGCFSSGFSGCQSFMSGIGLWPSFEIRNRHGSALELQTQFEPAYANLAYGGYIVRDTLFGAHKRFKTLGCMLSCMAMVNTYFGATVTVLALDKYLALNNGYDPTSLVTLVQVNGQEPGGTVTWTVKPGAKLAVNDTVLIESTGTQRSSPLATIVTGPTITEGTILRRHGAGVLKAGMQGVGYGLVRPEVASEGFSRNSGHMWNTVNLYGNRVTTPPLVESALVDSLPVLLSEPNHFVLARGWRPSFGSHFANGTYVLNDPGHMGVSRLDQEFVVIGHPKSYANSFIMARSCVPAETDRYAMMPVHTGGVTFILQGGGRLSIVDPAGHALDYYDELGGYDGNIGGANAWSAYGAGLEDDSEEADDPVEYVQLPDGASGDYRVMVVAGASATFGFAAATYDTDGNGPRAYAEYPLLGGEAVTFNVHVVQGASATVRIDTVATAGVSEKRSEYQTRLLVGPNPSQGRMQLVAEMAAQGELRIQVFDVAGRLIAQPCSGLAAAGVHAFRWNGVDGGGMDVKPGLYLVRMSAGPHVITKRLVVTR